MNVLNLEGKKAGIRVNAINPTAATRMMRDLMPDELCDLLTLESVSAGMITLCHEGAPENFIMSTGAGNYANVQIRETEGVYLPPEQQTAEQVAAHFQQISDDTGASTYRSGLTQIERFLTKAGEYFKSLKGKK
jgi:NAD(P)-dependent dehydrogenase (short-subunit alcohol dehydrogenase family)